MQSIDLHLFLKYHFFASANQICNFSISRTFCVDELLIFDSLHRIPCLSKSICDDITSLKEWRVYCKSLLYGRNSDYEEYKLNVFLSLLSANEFQKTNSDHLGKLKIRHVTILAIFWDKCSKILRPNLIEKLSGEYFEKTNIETVITYNNTSMYQVSVCLKNFKLWDQIWPKNELLRLFFVCLYRTVHTCHIKWYTW